MLELDDVTLSAGGQTLLEGASWRVNEGERHGLTGRNGSGKTTILRAILGLHSVDGGAIRVRPGADIGHLSQEAGPRGEDTLWSTARKAMVRFAPVETRLQEAEAMVARGDFRGPARLAEATEAFRLAGGYRVEETIGEVLHGLGFHKDDWERPCRQFSGGWRMRAALACLLLTEPRLLLLDEPTNHLDMAARAWLGAFLARYPHAVVLVSHDRRLLEQVTDRTAEIRDRRLHVFKGGLRAWLVEREARLRHAELAWERQRREEKRLRDFIDANRAAVATASKARSRKKTLARLEPVARPERERRPRFRLAHIPSSAHLPLELEAARLAWPGGPDVFPRVDLELHSGTRLALIGPNGTGKSTLLLALAGLLPLSAGRRSLGDGVRLGVFTQDLARDVAEESSALHYLLRWAPTATPEEARGALGALGLSGDMALQPAATLSGGERARAALALFALKPHNLLLLDEPTNHLDAVTVEVLAQALCRFPGAVIMASHDRYLVDEAATAVARVGHGELLLGDALEPDDLQGAGLSLSSRRRSGQAPPEAAENQLSPGAAEWSARKKAARTSERLSRQIATVQEEMATLEARLDELDGAMCAAATDARRLAALARERQEVEGAHEDLFSRWEELEEASRRA